MVDALLSAAADFDSCLDDVSGANEEFIASDEHLPPLRFCEFCNSSNTPTWRRGPAGKGSLCNACGIKWRLRKRMKKNEKGSPSSPPTIPEKRVTTPSSRKSSKKRKEHYDSSPKISKPKDLVKDEETTEFAAVPKESGNKRKKYYCKYCDQTFSLSQFRNSQQFGAHCSNCSRRPRFGDDEDSYGCGRYGSPFDSPASEQSLSSPESPQHYSAAGSNRDGLLMRLLYVVEHQLVDLNELEGIRDELSELKDELISREEARKAELSVMRARVKEDLAAIKTRFETTVAAHEQLAATRLMEMEQTIKMCGNGANNNGSPSPSSL